MVELSPEFFALAVPAVVFAGVSKGGFGGGVAFAASSFLALILSPAQAIGLMLPLLMVMDVTAVRAYWGRWDPAVARRLMLGALPGVATGALLYKVADADMLRLLIGLVALGFVAFRIARARGWLRIEGREAGPTAGYFWGGVAGLTSFISHAGGPPAAVYLLTRGLTKTAYQATTVLTFWAINGFKLLPYAALGIFDRDTLIASALLVPVAIVSIHLGVWLHRIVNERVFFALTYFFLTITGIKLIFDALT